MRTINQMIEETRQKRARDAQTYANLDWDLCMLCGARGADKRSLRIDCGYAIDEVVPEVLDMFDVNEEETPITKHRKGFFLLVCKNCRSKLLTKLGEWRAECLKKRGTSMNHDGTPYRSNDLANIPVRINGATVMMTMEEWLEREKGK